MKKEKEHVPEHGGAVARIGLRLPTTGKPCTRDSQPTGRSRRIAEGRGNQEQVSPGPIRAHEEQHLPGEQEFAGQVPGLAGRWNGRSYATPEACDLGCQFAKADLKRRAAGGLPSYVWHKLAHPSPNCS